MDMDDLIEGLKRMRCTKIHYGQHRNCTCEVNDAIEDVIDKLYELESAILNMGEV